MDNRPFIDINQFLEQADLMKIVIKRLKKSYFELAKKKNGVISLEELEDVFKRVKKDCGTLSKEEDDIIEGMFDSFLGAFTMTGDSDMAFHIIETQFNLFGEPVEVDEDSDEPKLKFATCYIREEIDGMLYFRHHFDIEYKEDQEIYKVAENWIQNNLMKAVWNNCHLEVVDHE